MARFSTKRRDMVDASLTRVTAALVAELAAERKATAKAAMLSGLSTCEALA